MHPTILHDKAYKVVDLYHVCNFLDDHFLFRFRFRVRFHFRPFSLNPLARTSRSTTKMACNDTNAIPTHSRYAGTYAAAIAGRYGREGMDCEWLAGLVWEGLGGLGMGFE